jgi:hypothetical protein
MIGMDQAGIVNGPAIEKGERNHADITSINLAGIGQHEMIGISAEYDADIKIARHRAAIDDRSRVAIENDSVNTAGDAGSGVGDDIVGATEKDAGAIVAKAKAIAAKDVAVVDQRAAVEKALDASILVRAHEHGVGDRPGQVGAGISDPWSTVRLEDVSGLGGHKLNSSPRLEGTVPSALRALTIAKPSPADPGTEAGAAP